MLSEGAGMLTYIADNPDAPGVICLTIELILSTAILIFWVYRILLKIIERKRRNRRVLMLFLKGIWGERRFCGEYTEMKIPRLGIDIGTCRAYPAWICHQLLETAGLMRIYYQNFEKCQKRISTI